MMFQTIFPRLLIAGPSTGSLQVLSEPSDKLRAMSQKLSVKNKVGLGNMPIWLYTLYSTLYVHLAS